MFNILFIFILALFLGNQSNVSNVAPSITPDYLVADSRYQLHHFDLDCQGRGKQSLPEPGEFKVDVLYTWGASENDSFSIERCFWRDVYSEKRIREVNSRPPPTPILIQEI